MKFRTSSNGTNDTASVQSTQRVRCGCLLGLSIALAVFCEVLPVDRDIMYGPVAGRGIAVAILVKILFLSVIFLPALLFAWLNGVSSLRPHRGAFIFVTILIAINLVDNIWFFWGRTFGDG